MNGFTPFIEFSTIFWIFLSFLFSFNFFILFPELIKNSSTWPLEIKGILDINSPVSLLAFAKPLVSIVCIDFSVLLSISL